MAIPTRVARIINYLVQYFKEHYPHIATTKGSAFYDLFIEAAANILSNFYDLVDAVSNASNLTSYDTATTDDYDALADFWLVERNAGSLSTATVRIYFSKPTKVTIPSGFRVAAGDLVFATTQRYTFGQSLVTSQYVGDKYYVSISVTAQNHGSEYDVAADTITTAVDPIYGPWTSLTNPTPASGGSAIETNEEYYDRIKESVSTRNLLITDSSIISTLQDLFPTFVNIDVVGYGDDQMQRDLYFGVSGPGGYAPYYKADYQYKLKGIEQPNQSSAHRTTSEEAEPDPETVEATMVEVEDSDYRLLGGHDLMFYECFGSKIFAAIYGLPSGVPPDYHVEDWIVSDSGLPHGQKKYGNSVYEGADGLYMGVVPSSTEALVPED